VVEVVFVHLEVVVAVVEVHSEVVVEDQTRISVRVVDHRTAVAPLIVVVHLKDQIFMIEAIITNREVAEVNIAVGFISSNCT